MTSKEFINKYQKLTNDLAQLEIQQMDAKRLNIFYLLKSEQEQLEDAQEYAKAKQVLLDEIAIMDKVITNRLSPLEQNIFYLKYDHNKSLSMIADELGYHISTIKKHHLKLMKQLSDI